MALSSIPPPPPARLAGSGIGAGLGRAHPGTRGPQGGDGHGEAWLNSSVTGLEPRPGAVQGLRQHMSQLMGSPGPCWGGQGLPSEASPQLPSHSQLRLGIVPAGLLSDGSWEVLFSVSLEPFLLHVPSLY